MQYALFLSAIILSSFVVYKELAENDHFYKKTFLEGTQRKISSNSIISSQIKDQEAFPQIPETLHVLDFFTNEEIYNSSSFDPLDQGYHTSRPGAYIFDTLIDYDFESAAIIPSLAQNWVVTNDSRHWTFLLRENILFHDGSKFNASVVKFNFDRLIDPTHPAYAPFPLPEMSDLPLESVSIISEYRVMLSFSTSYSPFSNVQAVALEIVSPNSFLDGNVTTPIGTGPYKFSHYIDRTDNITLVLTRNSDYFRGVPPFEQIYYTTYMNFTDYHNALLAEEGDISAWGGHLIDDNSTYWSLPSTGISLLRYGWLNHQREEFTNRKVRLAINYAVDKATYLSQIVDLNEGFGVVWDGDVPESIFPRFLPYRVESIPGYPYDPIRANELLDQAGYPRDIDGYRFDLEITVFGSQRAELLAGYLDVIGINCSIVDLPFEEAWAVFNSSDYEMIIWGWSEIYDPSFMAWFLHSNGVYNTGGYSNFLLDKLLELSDESPVHQEREFYFDRIQSIAQLDAPYLLLPEGLFRYPRAHHVSSLVKFNRNGRPNFNYSIFADEKSSVYSNIDILPEPLYFPFADTLISAQNAPPFNVNVSMSYQLRDFMSSYQDVGKFYRVSSDRDLTGYRFRCYYDMSELEEVPLQLIYRYDQKSNSWSSIDIVASNTSLRYIEVELSGGEHILSLAKITSLISYRFLPFISLIFGGVVICVVVMVLYNQIHLNQLKRRYKLQ
ncbi:MAG: ABC transporter substrate-binding protein [Candidatus Hodarchaeales archaeon]|jgi:peptide/nickel transport system substrate-binding protein